MGNVHMAPAELRACADSFVKQADEQLEIYNEMKTLINELGTDWRGKAFDHGILVSFNEQEKILRDRTELLRQFAQLIRETGDDFERMDNDLIRSFAV